MLFKSLTGAILATTLSASALAAADYYVLVPNSGKLVNEGEAPEQAPLTVTLSPYALPEAKVRRAYSFDFKPLLSVEGDAAFSMGQVAWSTPEAQLPQGLLLQEDGVLSGTPQAKSSGLSIDVIATYKDGEGSQVYTLVVGGELLHVTQIAVGSAHTCAVTTGGGVKCWGFNSKGQLGDGTYTARSYPGDVQNLTSGVSKIFMGAMHTCALQSNGALSCWGQNEGGQLGDSTKTNKPTPSVVSLPGAVMSAGLGSTHSCVALVSGEAYCWGQNNYGQLGDGTQQEKLTPTAVTNLPSSVAQVTAGQSHSCAMTSAGAVMCWGWNYHGQLGDGGTATRPTPELVAGLDPVQEIHSGFGANHTCALLTSGQIQCWGQNGSGQLGNAATTNSPTPVYVVDFPIGGAKSLSVGSSHTCAVSTSNAARCWGFNNQGRLGTGDTTNSSIPLTVSGLSSGVTSVTAGGSHSCARLSAGYAKCWGAGSAGQLGTGSTTSSLVPVDVEY